VDFGTIAGFVLAIATTAYLVLHDGDPMGFVNKHAAVTIFGGCIAASLIRFQIGPLWAGLSTGMRYAFAHGRMEPRELVDEIASLADISRKQGPLGLETVEVADEFLAKSVRMIADGYDADFIKEALERERDLTATRLEIGVKVYKSIGDAAPAFGMVGTLIGMVQMFMNMSDPSKLGPFMAISLLATLYGAVVANFICMPIADKLEGHLHHDEITDTLVIDGVLMIRASKSPAIVREMLLSYLPKHHRDEDTAEAA
jgi:chemotaxis protein MotA